MPDGHRIALRYQSFISGCLTALNSPFTGGNCVHCGCFYVIMAQRPNYWALSLQPAIILRLQLVILIMGTATPTNQQPRPQPDQTSLAECVRGQSIDGHLTKNRGALTTKLPALKGWSRHNSILNHSVCMPRHLTVQKLNARHFLLNYLRN